MLGILQKRNSHAFATPVATTKLCACAVSLVAGSLRFHAAMPAIGTAAGTAEPAEASRLSMMCTRYVPRCASSHMGWWPVTKTPWYSAKGAASPPPPPPPLLCCTPTPLKGTSVQCGLPPAGPAVLGASRLRTHTAKR